MGVASTYLSVVAAGALTAGVAAANVVPVPEKADSPDVDLAASITIPIIDIDTPGPVSISRLLELTLGTATNAVFGGLHSEAGTIYDLPGLYTNFQDSGDTGVEVVRDPGESIGAGLNRTIGDSSQWNVLGLVGNNSTNSGATSFDVTGLTGGTGGIGAALGGVLSQSDRHRELSVLGSGITSDVTSTLAGGGGELSFMPFDGFKAVGGGNLIDVNNADASLRLGSLELGGGGEGTLSGGAGLCLGSAQGTTGCTTGQTAFASLDVPIKAGFGTGGSTTNVFAVNIPTNLAVAVGGGQFSVEGDIGGTVSVGSVTLGRVIPVNVQIPNSSSMMLANNNRQSQTVRDSFRAVPGKTSSDNETGGRHRAPLRDAVANIKAAVDSAVQGKHAAKDSED
jgi:hypothetical protein